MANPERIFDHVLIIMFENQYRSYVMQNDYFKSLAAQGVDMQNHFGVMHPSQTNYIASIAGELCNMTDDDPPPALLKQQTIVDLIEAAGLDWRAYMDSYTPVPWTPDLVPADQYPYVIKHDPFTSFENIVRNKERWEKIVNGDQIFDDLEKGTFPAFAWFTPDMWNDGHYLQGTHKAPAERAPILVDQAAKWLQGFFEKLNFPGPDSKFPPKTLVVVNFDEADFEKAWDASKKYTYDGPNQIYTVLLGDVIQAGTTQSEGANHYSLIRTIEQNFGLGDLGKNDKDSNWFQFLWGKQYEWAAPVSTPIPGTPALASAFYAGELHVIYSQNGGQLMHTACSNNAWRTPTDTGLHSRGNFSLAAAGRKLHLAFQTDANEIAVSSWKGHGSKWDTETPALPGTASAYLDLLSYNEGQNLLLAWSGLSGSLSSLAWSDGEWARDPMPTGFKTDGGLTLAAIGPSIYLIHKIQKSSNLNVLSYNTADFNCVTVRAGSYGGAYDNTTKNRWSPSGVPVQHFSTTAANITPGEPEPSSDLYTAADPLVSGTLDGVIHLVHPAPPVSGADSSPITSETFSIPGIMTPLNPVSYDPGLNTITSNGYGTLAEAGWSEQAAIGNLQHANNAPMAMASGDGQTYLLFQPVAGGAFSLVTGAYS